MRAVRAPDEVDLVQDDALRAYLRDRFDGMVEDGETYSPETHGWFVLVEEGDDVTSISEVHDVFNPLEDLSGHRFGEAGFAPLFEWIADHDTFFEIVLLLSDGGEFVGIVVPRLSGVDAELLALCDAYATKEPQCL